MDKEQIQYTEAWVTAIVGAILMTPSEERLSPKGAVMLAHELLEEAYRLKEPEIGVASWREAWRKKA